MSQEQWDIEYQPFPTSPSTRAHLFMPVHEDDIQDTEEKTQAKVRERFDTKYGIPQGWEFVNARKGLF